MKTEARAIYNEFRDAFADLQRHTARQYHVPEMRITLSRLANFRDTLGMFVEKMESSNGR